MGDGIVIQREDVVRFISAPNTARVVVAEQPRVVSIGPDTDKVVTAGVRGIQGNVGPIGPSSTDVQAVAGQDIGGQRAVLWRDGGLFYGDPTTSDTTIQLVGITLAATRMGQLVQVRTGGSLDDPSFDFVAGLAVYLGPNGTLTQDQPALPFASLDVPIGTAIGRTALLIRIGQAISL